MHRALLYIEQASHNIPTVDHANGGGTYLEIGVLELVF